MPQENDRIVGHLEELRKRIFRAGTAVLAAAAVLWFFSEALLEFLTSPVRKEGIVLNFFSPPEAFIVRLQVTILAACLAASPVLLYELWSFLSPGLYRKEKKFILPLVAVMTVLFIFGALFAYLAVFPAALHFLLGFQTQSLKPVLSASGYISFLSGLILAFGFCFNLPVFVLAAVKAGWIDAAGLKRIRRHVVVGLLVLSAILTPPDIISQFLLTGPLWILYEISVWVASFRKPTSSTIQT